MAGYDDDLDDAAAPGWGERLSRLAGLAGALTSVALIAGLAIWGYRLAVRDVTGVPVIRAMEGPMRVAPEDPGGQACSAGDGLEQGGARPADQVVHGSQSGQDLAGGSHHDRGRA